MIDYTKRLFNDFTSKQTVTSIRELTMSQLEETNFMRVLGISVHAVDGIVQPEEQEPYSTYAVSSVNCKRQGSFNSMFELTFVNAIPEYTALLFGDKRMVKDGLNFKLSEYIRAITDCRRWAKNQMWSYRANALPDGFDEGEFNKIKQVYGFFKLALNDVYNNILNPHEQMMVTRGVERIIENTCDMIELNGGMVTAKIGAGLVFQSKSCSAVDWSKYFTSFVVLPTKLDSCGYCHFTADHRYALNIKGDCCL